MSTNGATNRMRMDILRFERTFKARIMPRGGPPATWKEGKRRGPRAPARFGYRAGVIGCASNCVLYL
jgi:hypothetical protein